MYKGALMLLKLKVDETWKVIGGMQTTRLEINNKTIESNNITNSSWRDILSSGLRRIDISATGIFTGSICEKELCKLAFTGKLAEYRLEFAEKEVWQGKFQIIHYDRFGDVDEEERYSISITSSGEITLMDYGSH